MNDHNSLAGGLRRPRSHPSQTSLFPSQPIDSGCNVPHGLPHELLQAGELPRSPTGPHGPSTGRAYRPAQDGRPKIINPGLLFPKNK